MNEKNNVFVVIDTNVLVSALYSKNKSSNPSIILNKIFDGSIIPLYNKEILKEYQEVLSRAKFNFPKVLIDRIISYFLNNGIAIERAEILSISFPDPDDIVFYEVKMGLEDSYLVTGNIKHFPKEPYIVTPAEFILILKKFNIL